MLKKITLSSPTHLINDVLLPKSVISESMKKCNAEKEFRKKIISIHKNAERNIEKLKVNAIVEGFELGFIELITVMSSYFIDYKKIFLMFQEDIMAMVREALEASIQQPGAILCLFDEWLSSQHLEGEVINIVIPEKCHSLSSKIVRKLETLWNGEINISYSDDFCFIFKNNKHVIEFRANDYFDSLLSYYKPTFNKEEYECLHISEKALSKLIDSLNQQYMAIKDKNTSKENK